MYSDDEGITWFTINGSLPYIRDFVISKNNYIYVATDRGVFMGDGNNIILSLESDILKNQIYYLSQNYPNPFNPSTKIKYNLPNDSQIQIRVFDILGRKVVDLVNEEKVAGAYEINFNASSLASGIYYYQLRAGEYVETKKMILLK